MNFLKEKHIIYSHFDYIWTYICLYMNYINTTLQQIQKLINKEISMKPFIW